jgi:hypothetical protein
LEQNFSWTCKLRHEKPFAGEQDIPASAHASNVKVHRGRERSQIARADDQWFSGLESPLIEVSAAMNQDDPLASHFLQKQSGPAK